MAVSGPARPPRPDCTLTPEGYYYRGDFDKIDDDNWKCFTNSVYDPKANTWTMKKVPYKQLFD